ncbi:8-oxo-dGTP pyrophosphatase MutT, NUDIX family [Glycomyces sambucus]|uniref:8-oxo-dGTP pyrophosphatase MutT, NUDIX family n=1 Tax=Glycomyces sambucus TaxID=380244 RepID=A0A1G9MFE7_9ACTN|nr:NUDIX domain-containing protein [Glycomyces sambucus]SDL72854.1 8-oxo-dGTP pyrophosphatase MutT, NUDIX family [Glycomyces sambucus]
MRISMTDLHSAIAAYGERWPGDEKDLLKLLNSDYPSCLSRSTMSGHFTASAAVLDRNDRTLLVHHRDLDLWLQPGGHIEPGDATLVDAARREVSEETGIDPSDLVLVDTAPILINVHDIPENQKKGEGAHPHFDVQYVFRARRTRLVPGISEVCAAEWRPQSDFPRPIVMERFKEFC